MARNTKTITIEKGRDKDKQFILTEMSAWDSNRWMISFMKQLARSGVDLPTEAADLGIAGLLTVIKDEGDMLNSPTFFKSVLSIASNIREEDLFPLLDQLLTCVKFKSPEGHQVDFMVDEQIEDSTTFNVFYSEIFQLHNFF